MTKRKRVSTADRLKQKSRKLGKTANKHDDAQRLKDKEDGTAQNDEGMAVEARQRWSEFLNSLELASIGVYYDVEQPKGRQNE